MLSNGGEGVHAGWGSESNEDLIIPEEKVKVTQNCHADICMLTFRWRPAVCWRPAEAVVWFCSETDCWSTCGCRAQSRTPVSSLPRSTWQRQVQRPHKSVNKLKISKIAVEWRRTVPGNFFRQQTGGWKFCSCLCNNYYCRILRWSTEYHFLEISTFGERPIFRSAPGPPKS